MEQISGFMSYTFASQCGTCSVRACGLMFHHHITIFAIVSWWPIIVALNVLLRPDALLSSASNRVHAEVNTPAHIQAAMFK